MFGGAFKMRGGILDMKDFMKEMVNTLSPPMDLYADLVPAFLWRWNSREDWEMGQRSTAKASRNKLHCLIQRTPILWV